MFIEELGNLPILLIIDRITSFASTCFMLSRNLVDAAKIIKTRWFDIHGSPSSIFGDPEFRKAEITKLCIEYHVNYLPRPARRHNKIGSVESNVTAIRFTVQKLLKNEKHNRTEKSQYKSDYEILSDAKFLKNIMYDNVSISSFEIVRGYTPNICGLPRSDVSEQLTNAYLEQTSRRAFHKFIRSKHTTTISKDLLPPNTPVYFF